MDAEYTFKLYVSGERLGSQRAKTALTDLFNNALKNGYHMEVIDIQKYPEKADEDGIIVIPTLIRVSPAPEKRFIGDFSDNTKLLSALTI